MKKKWNKKILPSSLQNCKLIWCCILNQIQITLHFSPKICKCTMEFLQVLHVILYCFTELQLDCFTSKNYRLARILDFDELIELRNWSKNSNHWSFITVPCNKMTKTESVDTRERKQSQQRKVIRISLRFIKLKQ